MLKMKPKPPAKRDVKPREVKGAVFIENRHKDYLSFTLPNGDVLAVEMCAINSIKCSHSVTCIMPGDTSKFKTYEFGYNDLFNNK